VVVEGALKLRPGAPARTVPYEAKPAPGDAAAVDAKARETAEETAEVAAPPADGAPPDGAPPDGTPPDGADAGDEAVAPDASQ
jgi:hypothetical protein